MFSIFHKDIKPGRSNKKSSSDVSFSERENGVVPDFNHELHHTFEIEKGSSVASDYPNSVQLTNALSCNSKSLEYSSKIFTGNDQSKDKDSETKLNFGMYKSSYDASVKGKKIQKKNSFQNFQICRDEINRISNSCALEILKERDRITSFFQPPNNKTHPDKFRKRIENLHLQQNEFENFVSFIKSQFTINNSEDKCTYSEAIFKMLYKEAVIFKQLFPSYGIRQKILNEIEKNQVTIISADCTYFLNVSLPLILSNMYQNQTIIACEKNEILCEVLQKKINSVFSIEDQNLLNSKIYVLSEEELLKRFSYTTFFAESNSYIIFNNSLKRSVIADILLADLRDLLVLQKSSKLILLLSPYDNVSKFRQYFFPNLTVSLLNLPCLHLPVKTVWKSAMSSPNDDFKDDVLNTIFSIHAVCEPGDIVVFLPSVMDILSVYEELNVKILQYQCNELKVICVEDSYSYHCLKPGVNLSSERKLFLLCSGYEQLIIPSATYVIDCGIQKEYAFNSETDTNILVPTFISHARAKMRKHLAGLFNVGICFRIYNKANYLRNMFPREHSEIFCVNPIHSMVKVFQHRPQKAEKIEFVESLPDGVQSNTKKLLTTYGAIDKDSYLTTFGEKLVKLPLPIKYSRLILFGIQWNFSYEAVILVAFFITKTRLFCESADEEHKKLIDIIKLNFNKLDSDSLTYLNIFKMWKENGFKKLWCNEHYINYSTLKSIRSKVSEICFFTHKYIGEDINQQFSENNDNNIIQMLFECFHDNLCSYTQHYRTGYKVLATKQFAMIHPSSFLMQKEDFPQFIIYDNFLASDLYVINITCIPFDFVMEFLHKNILNFSGSDLFENQLVERVIDNIGEKAISQVLLKNNGKKAREIEDNIKKETGAQVVLLEPILGKGSVKVYALPYDIEECVISLNNILQDYIQAMIKEEDIKVIEFKKDKNSVLFEIKWTKGAETVSSQIIQVPNKFQSTSEQKVSTAVENNSESSKTSISYMLKLVWPRRVCTGEGYLKLKNQNDFHRARVLALRYIPVGEFEVFVQLNKMEVNQLLLSEIPPEVTEEDLINSFRKYLQKCEFEIELCYLSPFETSATELLVMKKQIEENCRNETNLLNFDVVVSMPDPSSKYMNAYVNVFGNTQCLNKEAKNLSATEVNNVKLSCKPLYVSDLKCSVVIYNALQYRIKEELEIFNLERIKELGKNYSFKVISSKDSINIKLSSDDIEIIKSLQIMINDLLYGMKLDKNNVKNIHKLFCHGGHVFLKTLEKTENVLIVENFETKTIRLYGLEKNCNFVRQYIYFFLEDTESEIVKNIILSNEKQNRMILKSLIMQYGANLEMFIELCGLRSAALDIKTSCLSLYGKKESIEKAEECIKKLSVISNSGDNICCDLSLSPEEICPVCACPAENLTFRLEHCGHLYCSECIRGLIEQGNFPIRCCAENCSKDIILEDIKYVLDHNAEEINKLADKSMKAYLEKNVDKIYYCPSADCPMFVFKDEINGDKWNCPLCKNAICIKCNVVYHEGYSCDMYRGSREDPDYSFKVWQNSSTQCKRCPKCHTAIEKRDGCNHMTCSSCNCHFCWLCSTAFSSGNDVYNHIGQAHPGLLYAH